MKEGTGGSGLLTVKLTVEKAAKVRTCLPSWSPTSVWCVSLTPLARGDRGLQPGAVQGCGNFIPRSCPNAKCFDQAGVSVPSAHSGAKQMLTGALNLTLSGRAAATLTSVLNAKHAMPPSHPPAD